MCCISVLAGGRFVYVAEERTWEEARHYCRMRGTHKILNK
jgi:hypothetical protein